MAELKNTNPWMIGFWILVIAVAVWIGYAVAVTRHFDYDLETQSQYGEMFGGLGSLFSGLALAGVVIAILMQKDELELQRLELRETRAELKRSAEAQELLSSAAREQLHTLLATATLNALSTIASFHGNTSYGDRRRASEAVRDIEAILAEIDHATPIKRPAV